MTSGCEGTASTVSKEIIISHTNLNSQHTLSAEPTRACDHRRVHTCAPLLVPPSTCARIPGTPSRPGSHILSQTSIHELQEMRAAFQAVVVVALLPACSAWVVPLAPAGLPSARWGQVAHTRLAQQREGWMESDSTTIMGRSRTPALDAGVDEDDYSVLNLDVIARAMKDLKARSASLGKDSDAKGNGGDATALVQSAFREQSARRVDEAERLFVAALEASRSCGAAWYGLASLLHECQHGGLSSATGESEDGWRERQLTQAVDAALIAARYEPTHPRALALLGDVLNDLGNHREACRAWAAAEARGKRHWRSMVAPWVQLTWGKSALSPLGPREPLHSLKLGDKPVIMQRPSNGLSFTAHRVADRPHAFVLQGFSTEEERQAIITAGENAPMRQVPKASDGDPDDERSGCEVAWLASPVTDPDTPWARLMKDAAQLVLPPNTPAVPDAGPAEDLHVVKYATAGYKLSKENQHNSGFI